MKTAVAFLTTTPHECTLKFSRQVKETGFDVFHICDEEQEFNVVNDGIIHISDELCQKWKYVNSNINSTSTHIKKNPIAWDKMLLFFCEFAREYDFVWVFEDDCFIPSVQTIQNLHLKYSSFDLVTPNNFKNDGSAIDWHWRDIYPKIKGPYAYSMVCACGLSRNMLNLVQDYKNKNNSLVYIEVMFNTLALQNDLKVMTAMELKSIVWMGKWTMNEFTRLPNNVFHPIKDINSHDSIRELMIQLKFSELKSKKPLPDFLTDETNN